AFHLDFQLYVAHSLDSDTNWGPAIPLPVGDGTETNIHWDDLTGVIAIPGKVGVFWSNQNTKKDYFALHENGAGDDPSAWTLEVAGSGGKFADGHFSLKLASDGRVFAMIKTGYGLPDETLDGVIVRSTSGTWSPLMTVAKVKDNPTRELLMLD